MCLVLSRYKAQWQSLCWVVPDPIYSQQVITEESLLQKRTVKLIPKYYYKVKSLLQKSRFQVHHYITKKHICKWKNSLPPPLSPFAIIIQKILTRLNLKIKRVLPVFSYSRLDINEPSWELPSTRINLSPSYLPKDKTSTLACQKRLEEVIEHKYKWWKHMYASKVK